MFALKDRNICLEKLQNFKVNGVSVKIQEKPVWRLSGGKRKLINAEYSGFSVENAYGILVKERKVIPPGAAMFSPWMIMEEEDEPGVVDFRARELTGCTNLWTIDSLNLLHTIQYAETPEL